MGLDISYYTNMVRVDLQLDEDGEPVDWEAAEDLARVWVNADFPAQADGLVDGHYEYEDSGDALHCGYMGYMGFREALAKLGGHSPAMPADVSDRDRDMMTHYPCFITVTNGLSGDCEEFVELINFSDCEGTVGPATCAKLLTDFDRHAAAAESDLSERHISLYRGLHAALAKVAGNGALIFH